MNKRRLVFIIICFILFLFSCCNETIRIKLPSAQVDYGHINIINIYIDKKFNSEENETIKESLNRWHKVSNNFIVFNIFDKINTPGRLEDFFWKKQFNNSIFIWHADSKSVSEKFDDKYASYAGMWDLHGNIIIFIDRIDENAELYNVSAHEVGHMLGLKHIVYEKSIMQPQSSEIADCITKDDAYRLSLIYGCITKPECD